MEGFQDFDGFGSEGCALGDEDSRLRVDGAEEGDASAILVFRGKNSLLASYWRGLAGVFGVELGSERTLSEEFCDLEFRYQGLWDCLIGGRHYGV